MKSISALSQQYTQRFQDFSSSFVLRAPHHSLRLCVVIPAHQENLRTTFQSLGNCSIHEPEAVEIILVVNQSVETEEWRLKHEEQIAYWQGRSLENKVVVRVLGALEMPVKTSGVGLARKIGMDKALARLALVGRDGLIVCLDADCTVSKNYLTELLKAEAAKWNGLSLRYAHPTSGLDPQNLRRIVNYEIWLRYYHLALQWSGYRHYYATVGSSMAVRASVYAKVGGMNQRKAGEDFYFLHKVMPHGHFGQLNQVCVYPSPRVSVRVPFGTGRAMLEQERGQKDFTYLYAPEIFQELYSFHQWVQHHAFRSSSVAPDFWKNFLQAHPKLNQSFNKLLQCSKNQKQWLANFWFWWDGFRLLKFVHARQKFWKDVPRNQALMKLFKITGTELELLDKMRALDIERSTP